MNADPQLLDDCLTRLQQLPGIQADVVSEKAITRGRIISLLLQLSSPIARVEYACEIKQNVSLPMLGSVLNQLQQLREQANRPPLLISSYLTSSVSEHLIGKGFEFVDAAGNMYLNSHAAYVLVQGKRPSGTYKVAKSVITVASLKLIYALLVEPRLLETNEQDFTYRDLAQLAGISLGSVSSTIQNLYASGYLQRQQRGGYQLDDYSKLLSVWELGYMEKLRPKLLAGIFTMVGCKDFGDITEKLKEKAEKEGYLIGGELGGAIATRYLRPQRATLHVSGNIRELILALRLKPDSKGEITLLNQFGQLNLWGERNRMLASPLLMRAELLVEHDERLRETATLLLERYLSEGVANALHS